jgi:intracellular sulfur oxidation DsrE/DsrF family protein
MMRYALFAALLCVVAAVITLRLDAPTALREGDVTVAVESFSSAASAPVAQSPERHYFFDVYGHSADEIKALLERARDTYESVPVETRDDLRIAMVLHGPDVEFFARRNYDQYRDIVDMAAQLDAFGLIDMKVCAASASSRGIDNDEFPPFIEIVPYGPAEISRLEEEGYIRL